jgi:pyridoxamine 5'-phosphate oxidase
MHKDLGAFRKSYEKSGLEDGGLFTTPLELFEKWFQELEASQKMEEPNAMTLATNGPDGFPRNRVVLLKKFTPEGFIFFTNYNSEKGKAIDRDQRVCLSFYWPCLERQVIIKGTAGKVSESDSDDYFESRPEGSKLGAIVSNQSEVILSRKALEKKLRDAKSAYRDRTIPRPRHWGGYLVKPLTYEFWQGRPNRLHDRIRYSQETNGEWKIERLAP